MKNIFDENQKKHRDTLNLESCTESINIPSQFCTAGHVPYECRDVAGDSQNVCEASECFCVNRHNVGDGMWATSWTWVALGWIL